MKRVIAGAIAAIAVMGAAQACGTKHAPSDPSRTLALEPLATRSLAIDGSLNFGEIPINTSATGAITIRNEGNRPMTVTGITTPPGFTASWTKGVIAAGSEQKVTVQFTPTEPRKYVG